MTSTTSTSRPLLQMVALVVAAGLGFLAAQWLPSIRHQPNEASSMQEEDVHVGHHHGTDSEDGLWTCGMHPQVIQEGPGQCPICGMDLTPMRSEAPASEHAEHDGILRIDPAVVQNMNVRTAAVTRQDLRRPIRTVGYLEYDQQRMVTVTTKYSGWVEKVYVNYVGEKVRRGQPLFEIYSPELVQTEHELLSALDFAQEMQGAPQDTRQRAQSLVESTRIRLGYWDISPDQIAQLETTGEVFRTLEVTAPADGLVMKRMAGLEGMAVQPGMELFHIADLSSLWLSVELFENQMAWVQEGTEADITLAYFPGESFRGRVRFLEPELSETTRTVRAKIEVPNRGGRLRKGMYATVELRPVQVPNALVVPSQAVLRTGQRNLVVEALGDGRFMPREVRLGHEAEGFSEIRQGLVEAAEVVVSAQFLLDSESTLREAVMKMQSDSLDPEPMEQGNMDHGAMDHGGMDHEAMDHSGMDHEAMDHSSMDHSSTDHGGMDHEAMDHSGMGHGSTDHGGMDHGSMDHGGMDHEGLDHEGMDHDAMDHSAHGMHEQEHDEHDPDTRGGA